MPPWPGIAAAAALCVLSACTSGSGGGGEGGACVFGVEWNGVHYIDPAGKGRHAKLPAASGRYLGIGKDLCTDGGPSNTTWRLYSVPGVSPDLAVTTKDAKYVGIAEGNRIPVSLR